MIWAIRCDQSTPNVRRNLFDLPPLSGSASITRAFIIVLTLRRRRILFGIVRQQVLSYLTRNRA